MCGISYTKATFKIKKSNIKKVFYKIKKVILLGDFQKIFEIEVEYGKFTISNEFILATPRILGQEDPI